MNLDDGFRDDPEGRRFVLAAHGGEVVALYNPVQGGAMITETLTPPELQGSGLASRLAALVMDELRRTDRLILPVCPFFANWLRKHPEHADLVHPAYRVALGL